MLAELCVGLLALLRRASFMQLREQSGVCFQCIIHFCMAGNMFDMKSQLTHHGSGTKDSRSLDNSGPCDNNGAAPGPQHADSIDNGEREDRVDVECNEPHCR